MIQGKWFNHGLSIKLIQFEIFSKMIGHCTQVIRDKAYGIGCAIGNYKKNGWYHTYMACDYSLTSTIDLPIYVSTNRTGCQCKTGTNPSLPGLCSINEIYNDATFYN